MNYLITGANGLVGYSIVDYLRSKNANITCLIHKNSNDLGKFKNLIIKQGNLLDNKSLLNACKNVDIIIHCAATINAKRHSEYFGINHQGTSNLLNAAYKNRVKLFIYLSSWAASKAGGAYSYSKLLAEKEVQKYPNYLIVRPADIYSETKSHLINFIRTINSYPIVPIIGDGTYQVSPLFVKDLVKAIFISQTERNQLFTVVGPRVYTFKDITKLILRKLNKKKLIIYLPKSIMFSLVYSFDTLHINFPFNSEKLKRLTTVKKIENVFDFGKAGLIPLKFEDALDKFLLKNALTSYNSSG